MEVQKYSITYCSTTFSKLKTFIYIVCGLTLITGMACHSTKPFHSTSCNAGMKQGFHQRFAYEKNVKGYDSTDIYEEGHYLDNRKVGTWYKYYPGAIVKSKIDFRDGRPYGPFETYHENGQLEEVGFMAGRMLLGEHLLYSRKGCLLFRKSYNQSGQMEDTITYYHNDCVTGTPSGNIELQYVCKRDRHSHLVYTKKILEENTLSDTIAYDSVLKVPVKVSKIGLALHYDPVNGHIIPNGSFKVFKPNGDLLIDGEFYEGLFKRGEFYIYDKGGLIDMIREYVNFEHVTDPIRLE